MHDTESYELPLADYLLPEGVLSDAQLFDALSDDGLLDWVTVDAND